MKKNAAPALKEQVYKTVKNRLLDQTYKDGQVLTERALAEELCVSRTPVREAMRQLQKEVISLAKELSSVVLTKRT